MDTIQILRCIVQILCNQKAVEKIENKKEKHQNHFMWKIAKSMLEGVTSKSRSQNHLNLKKGKNKNKKEFLELYPKQKLK